MAEMKADLRQSVSSHLPTCIVGAAFRLKWMFQMPWRFRPCAQTSASQLSPVFIVGCGRSGNTLLRSMLVAGGEIAIPPESYVLPRIIRQYIGLSFLEWNLLASSCVAEFEAYKEFYTWNVDLSEAHRSVRALPPDRQDLAHILDAAYRVYAQQKFPNASRWGDKTPINALHLKAIKQVFSGAHFVHLVRDPRAVCSSYRESGLNSDIAGVARRWRRVEEMAARVLAGSERAITIRYEDMIVSPEDALRSICASTQLTFSDKMLEFWLNARDLGDVAAHAHHHRVTSPLDTASVERWKTRLSVDEIAVIDSICGRFYSKYGYRAGMG